jgi:DHA1 family multidrug resistance protein-like MFS transporter
VTGDSEAPVRTGRRAPLARLGDGDERVVPVIATGVGISTFSMSFWVPFVPLYLVQLGAANDAEALGWASVAFIGLGLGRLIAAPIWGVLADRFGRKSMFVRALFFAGFSTVIAALASEPSQVVVAFTAQGLLSGFVPAATALTSVTVSESKLGSALGTVNGAQYLGTTVGPIFGAVLAAVFGLRGSLVVAGFMPFLAALLVLALVPADMVGATRTTAAPSPAATPSGPRFARFRAYMELATLPVRIGLLLTFLAFAANQAQRLQVTVVIADLAGPSAEATAVGLAFTAAGLASVIGVVIAGRRLTRPGLLKPGLAILCIIAAVACLLLAASTAVAMVVASFALVSLAQAAFLPGTNTIIAASAPRERRGSVFGMAATAQALAFMIGPLAATAFAAVSLQLGFVVIAILYLLTAGLIRWKLVVPVAAQAVDVPPPADPLAVPVD